MSIGRNDLCPCGSGEKFKYCCKDIFKFTNKGKQSHWFKEEIEDYSTAKIIFKLRDFGIEITYDSFQKDLENFYSAEDLTEYWYEIYNINTTGFDDDFIWLGAWVLWERIPTKMMCDEEISDMILAGYDLLSKDKLFECCDIWFQAWKELKKHLKDDNINSLKKADEVYKGDQYLSNWYQYLDMELANAGIKKKKYFKKRIKFTKEFCQLLPDSEKYIIKEMKRVEAESYFAIGEVKRGEKKFKEIISEYPNWIWGYIGWGDQYGPFSLNKDISPNYKKAREIYEKAYEKNIEDKEGLEILEERINNLK